MNKSKRFQATNFYKNRKIRVNISPKIDQKKPFFPKKFSFTVVWNNYQKQSCEMQFHCIRHKLLTDFEWLLCCTPQRKKSILNIIRYFAKWFIIFFCDKQFTRSPEVKISNLFVDISDRLILGVMSGEKANYVFFFGFSNIYIIQNWQLSPSYR